MGEYIRYEGKVTILGVAESLYYATYQKLAAAYEANLLRHYPNNATPAYFLQPDSGYLFRFPFPDEDKKPIGAPHEDDFRGVPVKVDKSFLDMVMDGKQDELVYIRMQKLFTRPSDGEVVLGTVIKIPSEKDSHRIEEEQIMMALVKNIIRHHVYREHDTQSRLFYLKIAARMMKGYRLEKELKQKHTPRQRPRPGKGLGASL